MTVGELQEKLREVDPSLPVCLADWYELYGHPNLEAAEAVEVKSGQVYMDKRGFLIATDFLCIGKGR